MVEELSKYITNLDKVDTNLIDQRVADKGIEGYLNQQLVYLDCSRIINGMRMMQTIGYPYQKEISSYLYALHNNIFIDEDRDIWYNRLKDQHHANFEYEKENPPVWYGGKKAKDKWNKDHNATKLPRRKKASEKTIPGFGKELSNAEKLKRLNAQFNGLTFKLKPPKK